MDLAVFIIKLLKEVSAAAAGPEWRRWKMEVEDP